MDQGYTGERVAAGAKEHGIQLEVVHPKHKKGKKSFVLLAKRRVVERSFAWAARLRRLARDHERLSTTLASYYH